MMPIAALRLRAAAGGGPGVHRYWRLYITANDGSALYFGCTELRLKDAAGIVRSQITTSSSAFTASSVINGSNVASNAFDGNLTTTGWLSANATPPEWLKVDMAWTGMPGAFECRSFDIYGSHNAPTASPKDFELQWSDDNSNWTTAKAVIGQTGWAANELRTFSVP
jgi:hypothetical protein